RGDLFRLPPAEPMSAYKSLEAKFRRIGALQEAAAVLQWDWAAMMPPGGAAARAEQLATLKVLVHEALTDPRLEELLDAADEESGLDPWQLANLREMRRRWMHATAVPADLVEALSRASSECEREWRRARPENDFKGVLPKLHAVLDLVRGVAAAKAARLGKSPYEALLDEYEPDGSTAEIDRLFDELSQFLPDFIDRVIEHQARRSPPVEPQGPFPIERQRAVAL